MPIAWPAHILPEAIARSLPVALAGGLIGVFAAAGFSSVPQQLLRRPRAWMVPALALAFAVVSFGSLLPTHAPPLRADLTLTEIHPGPKRTVRATVRLHGADVARHADWFYVMSWQGKEHRSVSVRLRRVGPGTYVTTRPVPVYGTWKTMIRLHRGSRLESAALYLPPDSAIPAAGIPARSGVTRAFQADHRLLQRERKHDVPAWLFEAASAAVAAIILALVAWLGWAMLRQARAEPPSARPRYPAAPLKARVPVGAGS